ncbi:MAG: hypothetical protein JWQ64_1440 [Subtercola sp.]|nr:hypothetical protein [Subtercola sp.]
MKFPPRRTLRRSLLVVPALATAFALAACSSSASGTASSTSGSDPYNIVVVFGQTGALQQNTQAQQAGMQASVDTINAAGGVNGRQVKITYLDDKSDPTAAVTVLQQYLASNPKPDMVVPGIISNEALALAPILTREKIVSIGAVQNAALDDPSKYPYFFSNSFKSQVTSEAAAQFLKEKGAKKVALVTTNDALLQSIQPSLTSALQAEGIELDVFPFDPASIDVSPAFAEAKASGADWIYADAVGAAVPVLLQGRLKAGAETVPTIGGTSVSSGSFLTVTTPEQRQNLYPVLVPLTTYIAPADRSNALNALIAKVGAPAQLPLPLNNYGYGWDDIAIWASGAKQAGSADPDQMKSALENLALSGKNSPDRPWIIWDTLWSPTTHFAQASPDELTITQVLDDPKDGMIVPKP